MDSLERHRFLIWSTLTSLLFPSSPPNSLDWLSYLARKKLFSTIIKVCEEEPREDTCSHGYPLGECEICEEDKTDEIEECQANK